MTSALRYSTSLSILLDRSADTSGLSLLGCVKNMSAADEDDNFDESLRGDKKRLREKQRRLDIASAFEELKVALSMVDPSSNQPTFDGETKNPPPTRLSLIHKSTEALKRVHNENLEMRRVLDNINFGLAVSTLSFGSATRVYSKSLQKLTFFLL
jgi:hypothetical protein